MFLPKPSNLITVPCCETCRVSQSTDDEYFLTAIASSRDVSEQPDTQQIVEKLKRAIVNPKKKGFAALVNNSLVELDVHSESGIYIETTGAFTLDKERFDRVGDRIIRGLFHKEFNEPLPLHYKVTNVPNQDGFRMLGESLNNIQFSGPRDIGGVFWYSFTSVPEDKYSTVWMQVYYNALPFLGLTTDPDRPRT